MSVEPRRGPGLAVTSSTGVMSLAAGRLGPGAGSADAIESIEVATERRHAEELGPQLVTLLDRAELSMAELEWLAVDVGPGRFTGLRVGLATVRGLAFGLGLEVVGITSLEILAAGVTGPGPVTPVIDARRQEVFQQVFVDGEAAGPPRVGPPLILVTEARGTVFGDGFDRYADIYQGAGFDTVPDRNPMATDLLRLAASRTPRPGPEVGPVYLREPDAKATIRTRPQGVTG